MPISVCVAGATGWTGSVIVRQLLESSEFQLVGAIARGKAGQDLGEALGLSSAKLKISQSLEEVLATAQNDHYPEILKLDDELTAENLLPGFKLRIKLLFK